MLYTRVMQMFVFGVCITSRTRNLDGPAGVHKRAWHDGRASAESPANRWSLRLSTSNCTMLNAPLPFAVGRRVDQPSPVGRCIPPGRPQRHSSVTRNVAALPDSPSTPPALAVAGAGGVMEGT